MKTKQPNENSNHERSLGKVCVECGRQVLAQIGRSKDAIFTEARNTLKVQDRLLRQALNEAEALAWQTLYPHLVFPTLAAEKVQSVAAWESHQRSLGGQVRPSSF